MLRRALLMVSIIIASLSSIVFTVMTGWGISRLISGETGNSVSWGSFLAGVASIVSYIVLAICFERWNEYYDVYRKDLASRGADNVEPLRRTGTND